MDLEIAHSQNEGPTSISWKLLLLTLNKTGQQQIDKKHDFSVARSKTSATNIYCMTWGFDFSIRPRQIGRWPRLSWTHALAGHVLFFLVAFSVFWDGSLFGGETVLWKGGWLWFVLWMGGKHILSILKYSFPNKICKVWHNLTWFDLLWYVWICNLTYTVCADQILFFLS